MSRREPKVTSCCGCWSLETGCRIIGWLYLILYFIIFIVALVLIITTSLIYGNVDWQGNQQIVTSAFIIVIVIWSLYLIYTVVLMAVVVIYLKAIRTHQPGGMIPFMILLVIGLVMSLLQLISSGVAGILPAIISICLNIYVLVVVYSMYTVFKNERESPPMYYQTTTTQPAQMTSNPYQLDSSYGNATAPSMNMTHEYPSKDPPYNPHVNQTRY